MPLEMLNIEQLTHDYRLAYDDLADEMLELKADLDEAHRKRRQAIKARLARVAKHRETLRQALKNNPQLFEKPRTTVFDGIKVGLTKKRGKVQFDDEEKVIQRIKKLLPEDQAELLIRRGKESVHKPAVYDLAAADCKRLGIRIEDDSDEPVIKPADTDIDKMIESLLSDFDNDDAEAA